MSDFAASRDRMVETIAGRGVSDPGVLAAMRDTPREMFVDPELRPYAYEDRPLSIGDRQTISQPYIVALMIDAAKLKPGDRVLEIGTGSGYAAAVMRRLAARVYTVERHASLAEAARRRFAELGLDNIETRIGDGSLGWPEAAPFDAILVAASGPEFPDALKRQLAPDGRLVMPVGPEVHRQTLSRLTRRGADEDRIDDLGPVAFVPLIGEQGWPIGSRSNGGASATRRR
jgi:protein-L-isoaspartate(D-aspartate) O-methyltransferase